jgi:hypothetical protein
MLFAKENAMKTSNQIVCVLRSVDGSHQWVAAAGRHDLVNNETSMVGFFDSFEVRTGPSGSDVVTCYEPSRSANTAKLDINEFQSSANVSSAGVHKTCVLRVINGIHRYVDASGRVDLIQGETLVSGKAVSSTVKTGPYRSHTVSIWNFVGATERSVFPRSDEPTAEMFPLDLRTLVIGASMQPTNHVGVAAQ